MAELTYIAVYAGRGVVFRAKNGDAAARRLVERKATSKATLFRRRRGETIYLGTWDLRRWKLAEATEGAE